MSFSPTISSATFTAACLAAGTVLLAGCGGDVSREHGIAWRAADQWMVVDTHTHTILSDGQFTAEGIVSRALQGGCDAVAVTDHANYKKRVGTREYFRTIDAARQIYPDKVVLAGVEWNVPPYHEREHVTVLVEREYEEKLLPEFVEKFEGTKATAEEALAWLAGQIAHEDAALMVYNHPSRKDTDPDENLRDMTGWRSVNNMVVAFEGAPGHQKLAKIGRYTTQFETEDRWDPVAAQIGGTWDSLLDSGDNVWAALAVSDFHNDNWDYGPCQYARTHVLVPARSASGVLRGLRAGTFWADHDHILERLDFTIGGAGLSTPGIPGETLRASRDATLTVGVTIERGSGAAALPLQAEFIGNCASGKPELLHSAQIPANQNSVSWELNQLTPGGDGASCYIRLRIRRETLSIPDTMAYTNPVRIRLD